MPEIVLTEGLIRSDFFAHTHLSRFVRAQSFSKKYTQVGLHESPFKIPKIRAIISFYTKADFVQYLMMGIITPVVSQSVRRMKHWPFRRNWPFKTELAL